MRSVRDVPEVATRLGRRTFTRFVELEGMDRAMALAGQAFAALLPLLIVVSAVSPASGEDLADAIVDRFDLTGQAASAIQGAVAEPAAVQDGVSIIGALFLIVSALAFTRALQRLYLRAWRLPKLGVVGNGWGLAWLLAFSAYWSLQPVIVDLFSGATAATVSLAFTCALWLFTPWVLLGRQISWHRLLPQALLTATGITAVGFASVLYMPRAVSSGAQQFGVIGVAFALLSWLFVVAFVLVVSAALGVTLTETVSAATAPSRPDDAAVLHDQGR